jgi:hypothetical protein
LVAATLISVKLSVVWEYIVPLVIITLVGGIWTTFYMFYFGRRSGELGFERMCVQYGPEFKTSVAFQTGLYSIFAAPLILSAMLVIMYAPKWGLSIYHQMGIFLGLFVLILILLKVFKLWGKRAW